MMMMISLIWWLVRTLRIRSNKTHYIEKRKQKWSVGNRRVGRQSYDSMMIGEKWNIRLNKLPKVKLVMMQWMKIV